MVKNIIKNIILAQVASDAGKHIYTIKNYAPLFLLREVKTAEHFDFLRKNVIIKLIKIKIKEDM